MHSVEIFSTFAIEIKQKYEKPIKNQTDMESNETNKQAFGFIRKPGIISDTENITNSSIDKILSDTATGLAGVMERVNIRASFITSKKTENGEAMQFNVSDKAGKTVANVRYGKNDEGWAFEYMMSGDGRIHWLLPSIANVFREDSFDSMCRRFGEVFESYNADTRR